MSRWIEDDEGWHKEENSTEKGNAGYFEKEPPAVREQGLPLIPDSGGKVDWQRVYEERNKE